MWKNGNLESIMAWIMKTCGKGDNLCSNMQKLRSTREAKMQNRGKIEKMSENGILV